MDIVRTKRRLQLYLGLLGFYYCSFTSFSGGLPTR